jgi:hypothetical protein
MEAQVYGAAHTVLVKAKPRHGRARLMAMRNGFTALGVAAILACATPAHAQAPLFDLHSGFWINLHHYLHALGRSNSPLSEPLPEAATPAERDRWTAIVAKYQDLYGKRRLLFDDELVKAKLALAAAESRPALGDGAVLPAMQGALEAAAPIYRKYVWAAHDRANQRTISEARALLKQYGAPIAARLAASYDTTWPAQAIRIDFVYNAGPPGNAYTTNDPTHITIAQDPRHSGLALLEIMFHEASHGWDGLLMKEVDEAARDLKVKPPRDLWHALLFVNAGTITAEALAKAGTPNYEMYVDKEKLFAWMGPWRAPVAKHWPAFLAGTIGRREAITRIVRDLTPAP